MSTRKRQIFGIALTTMFILLSGCGSGADVVPTGEPPEEPTSAPPEEPTSAPADAPETRKQLVLAAPYEPDGLDMQQIKWTLLSAHGITTQPVLTFDPETGELIGDWIESLEISEDGKLLTFHLREGEKFSNGDPADAQALADSWERYKDGWERL